MSKSASWSFCEGFVEEGEAVLGARERAAGLGCPAVSPGTGALLRLMAHGMPIRSAVEIGTGAGVSGLYLLDGMPPGATLTTIDVEAEHQAEARAAFSAAGHPANRVRMILGDALEVVPRLAEQSYDLVVMDVDPVTALELGVLTSALLRERGLLALVGALHADRVPDPTRRDPATTAMRDLVEMLAADERLKVTMVPVGDGVLLAGRRPD